MPGINVDVANPAGCPTATELNALGIDAVRLVSKPDPNGDGVLPAIEQYLADLKAADIFALVVVTSESLGRMPANHHGWGQFGNEPDGQPPASWVMTEDQYVDLFNTYSGTYPAIRWVAAGLSGSDPVGWWRRVAPRLRDCAGFAVHPYLKTPWQAADLLVAMKALAPDKQAFVTEFNCDARHIPLMLFLLRRFSAGQYWYALSDGMNAGPTGNGAGFGLADHPDKLAAWQAARLSNWPNPAVVPVTPAPKPVLHQWASDNFWPGRPYGPPIALVLHTEAGSEGATEAWFDNSASQVSAHFGVGLDGRDDVFVQLGDSAWANGIREPGNQWDAHGLPDRNPNWLTVSIETEDLGNNAQPVTEQQYASVLADCRLALRTFPSIRWLLGHRDISPATRPNCPGARWIASGRFAQLAGDLGVSVL